MDKIPKVNKKDISRIIIRDFGSDKEEMIIDILKEYGTEEWHGGKYRVYSAILKLSNKNINKIKEFVEKAKNDYRDVLIPAEHPKFWEMGFIGTEKLSKTEKKKMEKENWEQYQECFNLK